MPIYEYVCNACGTEFEVMQKFSDKLVTKCSCGSKGKVQRKLSVPSFHLQGGGWYNEGYSGKKDGNGKAEAKGAPKAEAKGEGKATGESNGSKSEASTAPKVDKSDKSEQKAKKEPAAAAPA